MLAIVGAAGLAGCATSRDFVAPRYRGAEMEPLPEGVVAFRVFLTGNTGDVATGSDAVLTAIGADARAAGQASAVVFLGDETAAGIPEGAGAEAAARPVQALGRALAGYPGRIVAIPGDRDWAEGKAGVERLEDALIAALGDSVLTPGDQAGGPRDIELAPGLRLLAIDTAWWLRDPDQQPDGHYNGENVRSPADVATFLEQTIQSRDDDRLIVIGHHPVVSNGPYAGQRTVGQTVATLGLGPLVGQTVGTSGESLASERYRVMRDVLDGLFRQQDRLVYASSHDRSLQTFDVVRSEINRQAYLVSGTGGGRATPAVAGRGAASIVPKPGYQRLTYYADGSLWAETVEVDVRTGTSRVAFRHEIAGSNSELVDPDIPETTAGDLPANLGGTVVAPTDVNFTTGPFRNSSFQQTVWGAGYRDVWATPVTMPVLDLGTEAGGLVPLYQGGGNQTTGLRLQGADGREYGLRLVEKGGTGQIPEELRDGVAGSVVLDLRSAQTPFGALVAYPLSRAAGVLIARPRLVYVPDDPRLGRYRERFAGRAALLEVRADDDMRGVEGFDGVESVVSAGKLFEKLREDQDHHVDQRAFLRARMVDMMIADWDRHEDQWRWAAYEPGDLDAALTGDAATRGKVYVPVAKDHDFAFYAIGGVAPFFLRRFADERLQPFGEDYGSIRGLTANGFEQDRRFLNALTRDDMEAVARQLQTEITDDVIDRSVRQLPPEIYTRVGAEWTRGLRARRDRLVELAGDLYSLHRRIVDVVGSDERERFTATREADGRLSVVVRSAKDGREDDVLYARTFSPNETDEVRFYGFGGRDLFEVVGTGPKTVAVRVIGGGGGDRLEAPAGDVAVYDTEDGLEIDGRGSRVEDRRTNDAGVNRYDSYEMVLRRRSVFPLVSYDPTDGVVVGAQVTETIPGFRLRPVAATHTLGATVSPTTGGLAGVLQRPHAGGHRDGRPRRGRRRGDAALRPQLLRLRQRHGGAKRRPRARRHRAHPARRRLRQRPRAGPPPRRRPEHPLCRRLARRLAAHDAHRCSRTVPAEHLRPAGPRRRVRAPLAHDGLWWRRAGPGRAPRRDGRLPRRRHRRREGVRVGRRRGAGLRPAALCAPRHAGTARRGGPPLRRLPVLRRRDGRRAAVDPWLPPRPLLGPHGRLCRRRAPHEPFPAQHLRAATHHRRARVHGRRPRLDRRYRRDVPARPVLSAASRPRL